MRRSARILACLGAVAVAALSMAGSLINDDAMSMYKRALEEKNKPKATALLKGLLVENITLGIDQASVPGGDDYDWDDGVRAGLNAWENAIDDCPFSMARDGEKPDILIKFVDRIESGDTAQGLIRAQRHFYWQGNQSGARVTGMIFIRSNVGRRWIRSDEIQRVLAHELGHLLGLDDDHDGPGVMADFIAGRGTKGPSQQEIDSVIDFRKMLRTALKS